MTYGSDEMPRTRIHLATILCIIACTGRPEADTATIQADTTPPMTPLETACSEVAQRFRVLPSGRIEQVTDSFPAFDGGERRYGCVIKAYGPLREPVTVPFLTSALADSLGVAWTRDSLLVAGGSNGAMYGLRRGEVLCLFRINWNSTDPADSVAAQQSQYVAEIGCEVPPVSSN
jgi:hypothetical protein